MNLGAETFVTGQYDNVATIRQRLVTRAALGQGYTEWRARGGLAAWQRGIPAEDVPQSHARGPLG